MGDSSSSSKLRIIAASVPEPSLDLTLLSQSKTQITFSWIAGADGGTEIYDFEIFGDGGDDQLSVDNFV